MTKRKGKEPGKNETDNTPRKGDKREQFKPYDNDNGEDLDSQVSKAKTSKVTNKEVKNLGTGSTQGSTSSSVSSNLPPVDTKNDNNHNHSEDDGDPNEPAKTFTSHGKEGTTVTTQQLKQKTIAKILN